MYKHFFKRILDFCISFVAIVCISPILLVLMVWLHFANKGAGIFYTQERPGKDGKIFKVIKFKSMTDETDENGELLHNYERITPVGRFIRKTSLDELPQLFNVLKGDMSLIGPRPLLVHRRPRQPHPPLARPAGEAGTACVQPMRGAGKHAALAGEGHIGYGFQPRLNIGGEAARGGKLLSIICSGNGTRWRKPLAIA